MKKTWKKPVLVPVLQYYEYERRWIRSLIIDLDELERDKELLSDILGWQQTHYWNW